MNVLCYVPVAPKTPRIYARTIQSIFRAKINNTIPIVFGREDYPTTGKYQNICDKHNEARRLCLEAGFDGVLFIENDMIVPENVFQIIRPDLDVVYGLYVSRHGLLKWLAYTHLGEEGGLSLSQDPERARSSWGSVIETKGVGMGCTYISRSVLERIEFRCDPSERVADDWLFSLDCQAAGIRQFHDLGVVCGHMKPDGQVIWPDIDSEGLYKIEYPAIANPVQVTPDQPFQLEVKGFTTEVIHGRAH